MYYVYVNRPTGEVSSCYQERQESWQKLGTEYLFNIVDEADLFIYKELLHYSEIKDPAKKFEWCEKETLFRMQWVRPEGNPYHYQREKEKMDALVAACNKITNDLTDRLPAKIVITKPEEY